MLYVHWKKVQTKASVIRLLDTLSFRTWMTLSDSKSISMYSRSRFETSMRTSSEMSRVSKGRLAPLNKATGLPRAQNKNVGRMSLKSLFWIRLTLDREIIRTIDRWKVIDVFPKSLGKGSAVLKNISLSGGEGNEWLISYLKVFKDISLASSVLHPLHLCASLTHRIITRAMLFFSLCTHKKT